MITCTRDEQCGSSVATRIIEGKNGGKLTPWPKGTSGNPNGLPKGFKPFASLIRESMVRTIDYKDLKNKKKRMKAGEAMITWMMGQALYKGDYRAIELLLDWSVKGLDAPMPDEDPIDGLKLVTGNPYNLTDDQVLTIADALTGSLKHNSP